MLITVDDSAFFKSNSIFSTGPAFPAYARVDAQNLSLWGPLLEKAWAKLNGNYEQIAAGKVDHVLKALTGAPTMRIAFDALLPESPSEIWNFIYRQMNSKKYNYQFVLYTGQDRDADGRPVASDSSGKLNSCGIHMLHALAVLDVIPLYNEKRTVVKEGLLMIRDPYGADAMTTPTAAWNVNDTDSWTEDYRA